MLHEGMHNATDDIVTVSEGIVVAAIQHERTNSLATVHSCTVSFSPLAA